MNRFVAVGVVVIVLAVGTSAHGVTVAGGGSKRTDCLVQLQASGLGFPGGKAVFKGATCADGDPCDADGARNGACLYTPMICLNQTDPALPKCSPAVVRTIRFKGKNKKKTIDTAGLSIEAIVDQILSHLPRTATP